MANNSIDGSPPQSVADSAQITCTHHGKCNNKKIIYLFMPGVVECVFQCASFDAALVYGSSYAVYVCTIGFQSTLYSSLFISRVQCVPRCMCEIRVIFRLFCLSLPCDTRVLVAFLSFGKVQPMLGGRLLSPLHHRHTSGAGFVLVAYVSLLALIIAR